MDKVTLPGLINDWIKHDPLMPRHFVLWDHNLQMQGYKKPEWVGEIYHDCRWPKKDVLGYPDLGRGATAARVYDDRIVVVFAEHVLYKFQAVHPMFFQKLRGHLYDQHNRHHTTCNEYLR